MVKSKYYTSGGIAYSSERDDWRTPKKLFDELNEEFHFTVDLCASADNALCEKYYSIENDGLYANLSGEIVYCNPPYTRKIQTEFIKKCAQSGALCVMLLPARTDTIAFHEYIYHKAEIRFIKGRLHFDGAKNPSPFPSMIVIFGRNRNGEE